MSGIVGVVTPGNQSASNLLLYGLYALQHRGQVNTGIAMLDYNKVVVKKGTGLIQGVFPDDGTISLPGDRGSGHVKYGEYKNYDTHQPILPKEFTIRGVNCLISVDGNILNRDFNLYPLTLNLSGALVSAKSYLNTLHGAFAGIYLDRYKMIGFRDPLGLKPICVGKLDDGYIIASETCALDSTGATFIKDLEPGELVVIKDNQLEFHLYNNRLQKKKCLFEYIYIARPDSYFDQVSIYNARSNMGKNLFHEHPTEADIVMGAPDSGLIAAIGYAEASKIPYKDGIIKNRYIGRTFINPDEKTRTKDIFIKLNPIKEVLKGKRVVLVDDSIVRGSTSKRTIEMLREAGAIEVHVRIAAPMVRHSCDLSLDMPDASKLIAHDRD
ncbi:MAG: amidophosphoribosyltransferase, partial [Chloroflexi bacterium]|nr:amidophosphoribosyltransferase [Chloroflexota bacterium]